MKILDCTLRDGGYYTNWDFSDDVVTAYIHATNILPIDYIEIGYRSNPSTEYLGKYGYSPLSVLRKLQETSTKKIAVMLNEKSTAVDDLERLVKPIAGCVDMIRLAVDPQNFDRAVELVSAVKSYGFEVGFNLMYMSKWDEYDGLLPRLHKLDGVVDIFNMVDSFGSLTPDEVKDIFAKVRDNTSAPIGFHGHDNLQLSFINTLTAIGCDADSVDATILGMGRGAGNLKMELLLTHLAKDSLEVDFNTLGDVVMAFQPLLEKYNWGTSLPYILAGANSIPQKEVMTWVTNRTYSFNSIIRALDNRRNNVADNARMPVLQGRRASSVMLIGGGQSVVEHKDAIIEYLVSRPEVAVVFVTARYAALFAQIPNARYYCLVGNEAKRMKSTLPAECYKGVCILAPFPRTMGTEIPEYAKKTTYELPAITFTSQYADSCTAVGLQTAIELGAEDVYIAGYDGYSGGVLAEKESELTKENRALFAAFKAHSHSRVVSLTPTLYEEMEIVSIYQYL